MSNITLKLNLRQLKSHVMTLKGKTGEPVECLVLPVKPNQFIVGEKGIYLDLVAFELKDRHADRKDTHAIKQSFPKEVREKMTDEELGALPFLGSLIVWGTREPAPVNYPLEQQEALNEASDDLPF